MVPVPLVVASKNDPSVEDVSVSSGANVGGPVYLPNSGTGFSRFADTEGAENFAK